MAPSADDKLIDALRNGDHVLHELLPERVDISYNLRSRFHDRVIPEKKGHLAEKNSRGCYIKAHINNLIGLIF